ncbi:MAG: 4'-phosphopantetheinyl transferase superfamily protein [Pseudomonadota bacterium]
MARAWVQHDRLDVDAGELAALTGLLGADERARADRFRFARDRRRFIVRRARLRQWLGAWVGRAPEALTFAENSHGKPFLVDGPPFSLSHSAEMMMLAIGDADVGCDIERIDPALDWQPLAEAFFTGAECTALAVLPPDAGRRAFFACWARKEAFVKALGLGLSYPLDAFDVSVGASAALLSGGAGWTIAAGVGLCGYSTALVARDDAGQLVVQPMTTLSAAA